MMRADDAIVDDQGQVDLPDHLFEIQDPEVNLEDIMAQIRQRLAKRRKEFGYDRRTFPTFGVAAFPGAPDDLTYDPTLYHYLRLVNDSYSLIETAPNLAESPATRIPVLGRLWQLIRAHAHSLVLFYVNRNIAQQVNINRHMVSTLNRLTALSQEQQREIIRLKEEVAALRAKDNG